MRIVYIGLKVIEGVSGRCIYNSGFEKILLRLIKNDQKQYFME